MNYKALLYMGIIIIGIALLVYADDYTNKTIGWKIILGGFVIGAIRTM